MLTSMKKKKIFFKIFLTYHLYIGLMLKECLTAEPKLGCIHQNGWIFGETPNALWSRFTFIEVLLVSKQRLFRKNGCLQTFYAGILGTRYPWYMIEPTHLALCGRYEPFFTFYSFSSHFSFSSLALRRIIFTFSKKMGGSLPSLAPYSPLLHHTLTVLLPFVSS